jgi:hypothetical protein
VKILEKERFIRKRAQRSSEQTCTATGPEGSVKTATMKYWEIIADNLKKARWSLGWVSAVDSQGRMIWIVDVHGYGKRFIVRTDEKLTAFLELEPAIRNKVLTLSTAICQTRARAK